MQHHSAIYSRTSSMAKLHFSPLADYSLCVEFLHSPLGVFLVLSPLTNGSFATFHRILISLGAWDYSHHQPYNTSCPLRSFAYGSSPISVPLSNANYWSPSHVYVSFLVPSVIHLCMAFYRHLTPTTSNAHSVRSSNSQFGAPFHRHHRQDPKPSPR